ncbi:MAG: hypothetical protein ACXQS8_00175 [Candidatus Helarchaeales archaeon]
MVMPPPRKKPRSLCPRCGSPMMAILNDEGVETGKRCPACFYTIGTASTTLKFRDTVEAPAPEKSKPDIEIFNVLGSDSIEPTNKLESDKVALILDRKNMNIWIWKGKKASPRRAYDAGTQATRLKSKEKMYRAHIKNVDEGEEPPDFPKISEETLAASVQGTVNFYRLEKGELKKIDKAVFTSGDVYIADKGDTIYIWIGKDATVDEKFSGAHIATMIDSQRGGEPKIVTIDQGKETKEFLKAVGSLKVVDKDVAESILTHYEKPIEKPVLYRVSSEEYDTLEAIQYIQVPLSKDSLDGEDVFLLDDLPNNNVYIWIGKGANVREKVVGGRIARAFDAERPGVQNEIFVYEGEEPEEFKRILGME